MSTLTKLEVSGDEIIIRTSSDVVPATSTLQAPFRIVIDLPNSNLGTFAKPGGVGQVELQIQHPKVEKIRYSQYSDTTVRIVLDMKQNSDYHLTETKPVKQWAVSFQDKKFTVVVDAGHGDSDPGAMSITSRKEKDFTLSVANKVYKLLQKEPSIKTIMTRTGDTYPTLQDRVDLANRVNADLFISIHGNSFKPEISGTETYYTRADSISFAGVVHRRVTEATGLPDRGVRNGNLKVTRETTMPAVLVEVGYLSNSTDESLMYTEEFQDRVAASIAAAIKEQLNIPDAPVEVKSAPSQQTKQSESSSAKASTESSAVKTAPDSTAVKSTGTSETPKESANDKAVQPAK